MATALTTQPQDTIPRPQPHQIGPLRVLLARLKAHGQLDDYTLTDDGQLSVVASARLRAYIASLTEGRS